MKRGLVAAMIMTAMIASANLSSATANRNTRRRARLPRQSAYASTQYDDVTSASSSHGNGDFSPKRNFYTGRFCKVAKPRRVRERYVNGTETYLKRVVARCPWSSLYCNKRVSYVIDTRKLYATRWTTKNFETWVCCPGFSGVDCDRECLNCTTNRAMQDDIAQLQRKASAFQEELANIKLVPGPRGPPGPAGDMGHRGVPGPPGLRGPIGVPGVAGPNGDPGIDGQSGRDGTPGKDGKRGLVGPAGPSGAKGERGQNGAPGQPGLDGVKGKPGRPGDRGPAGVAGPEGPVGPVGSIGPVGRDGARGRPGLPGPEGPRGAPGRPGPPGTCSCGEESRSSGIKEGQGGGPPAEVNFCLDGRLWRRDPEQLSCDFDLPNARSLIGRATEAAEQTATRRSEQPRGKGGGSTCLFDEVTWSVVKDEGDGDWLVIDDEKQRRPSSNFYLLHNSSSSSSSSRLSTLFFVPKHPGTCLTFHYLLSSSASNGTEISVFLLPCDPSYRIPVLQITPVSPHQAPTRQGWSTAVVPLPHHHQPYRVIIEAASSSRDRRRHHHRVAVDDVVFSPCGSKSCIHQGVVRPNLDLWKEGECRECLCMDGEVKCHDILCPTGTECKYTYKPEGYCCPRCCPNQEVIESSSSGSGAYGYSDGSDETYYDSDDSYYGSDDYEAPVDHLGCPVPPSLYPRANSHQNVSNAAVCSLVRETGPCRGSFARFHFDADSARCLGFVYGGCEGNANNFESVTECERSCLPSADPAQTTTDEVGESEQATSGERNSDEANVCLLPVDPGPCGGSFPVYHYDTGTDACALFVYGGCDGNANRFGSLEQCRRACGKTATGEELTREEKNRCLLPRREGSCANSLPRFYYDASESRCKLFAYTGCDGNGNRFATPWQCRDLCGGGEPFWDQLEDQPETIARDDLGEACLLPFELDRDCRAWTPGFYFDAANNRCQLFTGGCPVTDNNFVSPQHCQQVCGGEEPSFNAEPDGGNQAESQPADRDERCLEGLDEGPCKSQLYRFFYDPHTGSCSTFIYGGCRGNANRFETGEECARVCATQRLNFTITLSSDLRRRTEEETVIPKNSDLVPPLSSPETKLKDEEIAMLRESVSSLSKRLARIERMLQQQDRENDDRLKASDDEIVWNRNVMIDDENDANQ